MLSLKIITDVETFPFHSSVRIIHVAISIPALNIALCRHQKKFDHDAYGLTILHGNSMERILDDAIGINKDDGFYDGIEKKDAFMKGVAVSEALKKTHEILDVLRDSKSDEMEYIYENNEPEFDVG